MGGDEQVQHDLLELKTSKDFYLFTALFFFFRNWRHTCLTLQTFFSIFKKSIKNVDFRDNVIWASETRTIYSPFQLAFYAPTHEGVLFTRKGIDEQSKRNTTTRAVVIMLGI